jgi:hypothetical protein
MIWAVIGTGDGMQGEQCSTFGYDLDSVVWNLMLSLPDPLFFFTNPLLCRAL